VSTTGAQAWIAGFYDVYVTTTIDVPFFQEELKKTPGPVLELMAGTGRLSLPLAEAGARLTCVDVSGPMLARLRTKLVDRGLEADLVEADICRMTLPERSYGLALLPFQSFGELVAVEAQRTALDRVAAHLRPGGRFVCTMHNPAVRRATVDGQLRLLGTFPLPEQKGTLLLWTLQQFLPGTSVVQALQFYERYDPEGRLEDKHWLDVRFSLVERGEFQALAEAAGFRVAALYGSYDRSPFHDGTSPFMIWVLERCRVAHAGA
jgi:ubiquinone/menaquinone biosynthesis C-methylase UbiE